MLRRPILALLLLAACGVPEPDVRRDWTRAVADLGLAPIYPMRDGVEVGALWVADGPGAAATHRPFAQLSAGQGAATTVALPSVRVDADDAATLGLGTLLAALGISGARDDAVTLSLKGVRARAIDDATAWGRLRAACAPGAYLARRQGAFDGSARSLGAWQRRGRPGYLTVVTTVYSATGIDYELTDTRDLSGDEGVGETPGRSGAAGSAAAAGVAAQAAGGGARPRGGATEGRQTQVRETLTQSFATPLAFAYDGFTVSVAAPGTLCRAVQAGQAAPVTRGGRRG